MYVYVLRQAQMAHNVVRLLTFAMMQVGQYYLDHSDYIEYQYDRPCGVRILTAFLYLNTVEDGGGTNFPQTEGNLTVQPVKGKAVLWPSVLDENPHEIDHRTEHAALPVLQGEKYAANAWFHQRDFVNNNALGCA